ncbi:MAG: hypothetical protein EXS17_00375 [Phycisphaerales bacterium]|nr:hypothetical protein [Phycisphaerales bacterium]
MATTTIPQPRLPVRNPTASAQSRIRPSAVACDSVTAVRDLDADLRARTSRIRLRSSIVLRRS